MASTAYNRLFNTQVVHDFYVDNISKKDLAFAPTESTSLAMKNSNMLFRNDSSGFRLLYKVDDNGAPFISFSNVRLVFAVQLLNINEFLNFTDLAGYAPGKILYFTNLGAVTTSNLTFSFIDFLRPTSFTYEFPNIADNSSDLGSIVIKDQAGNTVTPVYPPPTGIVPDPNNRYSYPIDFANLPKGLYEFKTTSNDGTETRFIYIDNELARQGVFGIVDILATNGADGSYPGTPGPPPSPDYRLYKMNFVRRETKWRYILVLKSPSVYPPPLPADIDILDESSPPQTPYGALTFNGATAGPLVNGFPSMIIESASSTIPYFEEPKKSLSVKVDPGTGFITVVTDVQGPPLGVVSADPTNFNITQIFVTI